MNKTGELESKRQNRLDKLPVFSAQKPFSPHMKSSSLLCAKIRWLRLDLRLPGTLFIIFSKFMKSWKIRANYKNLLVTYFLLEILESATCGRLSSSCAKVSCEHQIIQKSNHVQRQCFRNTCFMSLCLCKAIRLSMCVFKSASRFNSYTRITRFLEKLRPRRFRWEHMANKS